MKLKNLLFLFLICLSAAAIAQPMPPPSPVCIAMNADGSQATISWITPTLNGNVFDNYQIFHSTNQAGPFNLVATVPVYLQTTEVVNLTPSGGPEYFYLTSNFNGGTASVNSDVIASIVPTITNTGNGTLLVTWNPISNPAFPSTAATYRLFRKYPLVGPNFVSISTTIPQPSYEDTIRICEDTVYYRIEITDLTGCTSISTVASTYFVNPEPIEPKINEVTVVQATQLARITWQRSPSRDTKGYNIYKLTAGGSPTLIAYQPGWNSTTYTDATSLCTIQSETYRVATVDSCDKVSSPSLFHNSIYLEAFLDPCSGIANLKWNSYISWEFGVLEYRVYVSQNGSPFALLATLGDSTLSYQHFPLIQGTVYAYYIEAVDKSSSFSSGSNFSTILADVPVRPNFLYVKYVTVDSPKLVKGAFFHDINADIIKYVVYKSKNQGDTYEELLQVPFDPVNSVLFFEDTAVFTNRQSYSYKVHAVDSCLQEVLISQNEAKTIFLRAQADLGLENAVTWSNYGDWVGDVRTYKTFRGFEGAFSDIPASNVPAGTNTYRDDISSRMNKDGEYCYYVRAYQGLDTLFFFADSSKSNEVCVRQAKTIYIPNAFTPDGFNKVFKPYMTFVNPDNYLFRIFDQWGEKIFETTEPEVGWDGTVNGKSARMDTYVYFIRYQNEFYQFKEQRGTLTLIR
jgi:gliding motility-associated-like protein